MNWFKRKAKKEDSWPSLLFARDREEICKKLQIMTDRALAMTDDALTALRSLDPIAAEATAQKDEEVDQLELEIEDLCLSSLALRQPVREDLRFIFSTLKTVTDLERVGDQAVNIARRVKKMRKHDSLEYPIDLVKMMQIAGSMVADGVKSLIDEDAELAENVARRDDEVDAMNRQLYQSLIKQLRLSSEENVCTDCALELLIVGRNIERIGDHGGNIAERAYYTVTGSRLVLPSNYQEKENDGSVNPF